jgi:hypothetical protein
MFVRIFILRFFDQIAAIVHHGLILFEVPPADLCQDINAQPSNVMVVSCTLYSVNLKLCVIKHHLFNLEISYIIMPRLVLLVNG